LNQLVFWKPLLIHQRNWCLDWFCCRMEPPRRWRRLLLLWMKRKSLEKMLWVSLSELLMGSRFLPNISYLTHSCQWSIWLKLIALLIWTIFWIEDYNHKTTYYFKKVLILYLLIQNNFFYVAMKWFVITRPKLFI